MVSALVSIIEDITVKKVFIGLTLSILYLWQAYTASAGSQAAAVFEPPVTLLQDQDLRKEAKSISTPVEVISDKYGGQIYYFEDGYGNKFATNSPEGSFDKLLMAEANGLDQLENVEESEWPNSELEDEDYPDIYEDKEHYDSIPDPLEPLNRVFFTFNDKLYFWVLKPVAKGYGFVVPEPARVSVRNFFKNLGFPVRFVNCLLQAKFTGAGNEFSRFLVNSIIGLAGFFDPATNTFELKSQEEDFGQTLGVYGLGPAFYINWPILGPSSLRDTIGFAGDTFLDPIDYLISDSDYELALKGYKIINNTSLRIGDYEDLKDAALDPYLAVRDAYFQYRRSKIEQ